MRRRPVVAVGLTAISVILLAGCSDDEPGVARPADTNTGQPTSTSGVTEVPSSDLNDLPSHGAPAVPDPIDTSAFEQDPCRMLTDEQAEQVGVNSPGEPGDGAVAPSCTWRHRESGASLNIQFDDSSGQGLSGAYAANESGAYDLWLELDPIDGFPAVAADGIDSRDNGECPILVGTSDEVTFQLDVMVSEDKAGEVDPCEAASQVAALTLTTMKEGA